MKKTRAKQTSSRFHTTASGRPASCGLFPEGPAFKPGSEAGFRRFTLCPPSQTLFQSIVFEFSRKEEIAAITGKAD
jgi:hypothetical protein